MDNAKLGVVVNSEKSDNKKVLLWYGNMGKKKSLKNVQLEEMCFFR